MMRTVAIVPPLASDLVDETLYNRLDRLVLRNILLANALNGCAISMPSHRPGEPPVGLMLLARRGAIDVRSRSRWLSKRPLPKGQSR
jgi:aspartyl-tRNA(Asn)/glutamyl-tRNA(Gln) amidotransferase subunit A